MAARAALSAIVPLTLAIEVILPPKAPVYWDVFTSAAAPAPLCDGVKFTAMEVAIAPFSIGADNAWCDEITIADAVQGAPGIKQLDNLGVLELYQFETGYKAELPCLQDIGPDGKNGTRLFCCAANTVYKPPYTPYCDDWLTCDTWVPSLDEDLKQDTKTVPTPTAAPVPNLGQVSGSAQSATPMPMPQQPPSPQPQQPASPQPQPQSQQPPSPSPQPQQPASPQLQPQPQQPPSPSPQPQPQQPPQPAPTPMQQQPPSPSPQPQQPATCPSPQKPTQTPAQQPPSPQPQPQQPPSPQPQSQKPPQPSPVPVPQQQSPQPSPVPVPQQQPPKPSPQPQWQPTPQSPPQQPQSPSTDLNLLSLIVVDVEVEVNVELGIVTEYQVPMLDTYTVY